MDLTGDFKACVDVALHDAGFQSSPEAGSSRANAEIESFQQHCDIVVKQLNDTYDMVLLRGQRRRGLDSIRFEALAGDEELKFDNSVEQVVKQSSETIGELSKSIDGVAILVSRDARLHMLGVIAVLKQRLSHVESTLFLEKAARVSSYVARTTSSRPASQSIVLEAQKSIEREEQATQGSPFELTEADQQMLQQENDDLMRRFEGVVVDAEQIQRQLGELSRIMDQFSREVVKQRQEMERITEVIVSSVVAVDAGNVHLRKATSNGVDFRTFILAFMIILTCSLLFLHWYTN